MIHCLTFYFCVFIDFQKCNYSQKSLNVSGCPKKIHVILLEENNQNDLYLKRETNGHILYRLRIWYIFTAMNLCLQIELET